MKPVPKVRPQLLVRICATAVILAGGFTLLGRAVDIPVLKGIFPTLAAMKASTAAGMAICGVALALLSLETVGKPIRLGISCLGLLVILLGTLSLGEDILGWKLGIDQWLARREFVEMDSQSPAWRSPAAAFSFLLLGSAVMAAAKPFPTRLRLAALAALGSVVIAIGGLSIVEYLSGAALNHYLWNHIVTAVHAAVGFVLLGFGLLALVRSKGWPAWSLETLTTAGFMAGAISLLVGVGVSFNLVHQLVAATGWVSHTREVIREIQKITVGVAALESCQLGYVNTGAERWLDRYDQAEAGLQPSLATIRSLTADNPNQLRHLDRLGNLIAQRIDLGRQIITARRRQGISAAVTIIAAGSNAAVSDSIRRLILEMEDEEYSLLDQRQREQVAITTKTFLLLRLGVFVGLTILSLGLFLLNAGINERKRLEAGTAQLAAIVESSDDAIIGKDVDGVVTTWNAGAERIFGYAAPEMVGRPIALLIAPDRRQEEAEMLDRIRGGENIPHFETVRRHKDGHAIDVSVTVSAVRDASGRVVGASKVARDITAHKNFEEKLRAQLARTALLNQITRAVGERRELQSIFKVAVESLEDNMPVDFACACLYDEPAGALKVVCVGRKSALTAAGAAVAEKAVIPIDDNSLSDCVRGQLIYEPEIAQVRFPFLQSLARGGLHSLVAAPLLVESKIFGVLIAGRCQPQGFVSGECEFLKQVGEHIALASHQSQLYDSLRLAYEDLRETQQAVIQQERLRVLGQLASGIAHDINNAISPVALYTESLLETEPNLSDRARDYLQTIRVAVHDVAETIARMREFSGKRELPLALAPVRLNQLLEQVVAFTRPRWHDEAEKQGAVIQVLTEFAADLPAFMGIESEIREALTNLVLNAVDAMPGGGTLRLRTVIEKNAAVSGEIAGSRRFYVEVIDTGVGMDEDTRSRCLEPFFTTKGERGTGLGLAMVYGTAQRHGADIAIESASGEGTIVRLSFLAAATASSGADQPPEPPAAPSHLRILVVDDDPVVLKTLRDILETDGHVVVTASGGQEGMDAFRRSQSGGERFAAVITDLGMPRVDGRKVASYVKVESPSTPVILLTGWGQRLAAEGDVPAHVDRVLNKPPKLRDLREALALCHPPADL